MTHDDSRRTAPHADPSDPTPPELQMTQHPDPPYLAASPVTRPFRVEPAVPVPDDAWAATPLNGPVETGPGRVPVTVRRGPRPGAVVFGLLLLLVSAYVIVVNVSSVDLELRLVGPALVGALGGLLLLVGLAGVLIGRLRR